MILSIIRDAIHIKMRLRNESPLISVPEFCYAAGLACSIMEMDAEQTNTFSKSDDFQELKQTIQHLVKESDKFSDDLEETRLQSLIVSCRIDGEMSDEGRELFEMGYTGK